MCNTVTVHCIEKHVEQMIKEKDSSISFAKLKETAKISKNWSAFSQVYGAHIKRDLSICDRCETVLIYKPSTESGCMCSQSRFSPMICRCRQE